MRIAILLLLAGLAAAQNPAVRIRVDASDAPRRLFHIQMTFPAKPGPMTLLYPQWIPGEHGPTGPITDLVGLKFVAGNQTLPWKRDAVNMCAFHITVPAGATTVEATFDFISPPETGGFSSGSSVTSELAVMSWNQFLLYPEGATSDSLNYQASLRVPRGWRYGTALPIERETGDEIQFKPASLTTLIDSPVSAGAHYRSIELGRDGQIAHYLHIAADSDRALEITPEQLDQYKRLVKEAGALFGSRHFRGYHFLLTLSDHIAHFGLEHHESSDDRVDERTLIDDSLRRANATLLPHEFVHSWNGKFRRPEGLATGDFDKPMKGELLWVYEGLTNYLGEILAPRSGLYTQEDFREALAVAAARLDKQSGRTWRPLEDTAIGAQLLYEARDDYASFRRGVDFYDEGTLIWLDADVLIRQRSRGAKTLDDFCHSFHGGPGGAPALKTYTFEDVVAGLNSVVAYDWSAFLKERLTSLSARAPLGGIENGGWKLTYNATRSDLWRAFEERRKNIDHSYSIGMVVKEDGVVQDVAMGGPAQKAGVAPSVKIIAIDNRQFSPTILREAVGRSTSNLQPIELLVKDGEYYRVHRVDYHGGEKYPHLERDASKPDLLTKIIEPRTK